MRTDPNQAIAGVRKLLREAIGPELQSEQALFLLRRIMAVLRATDWNEAGFALLAENAAFVALAADVRAALGDVATPAALADWEKLAATGAASTSYAAGAAANLVLREAAAATIDGLTGSPASAVVRRAMLARLLCVMRAD